MEFEQAPGDGEGQGNLACCSLWGHRDQYNWATEYQNGIQLCNWNKCICSLWMLKYYFVTGELILLSAKGKFPKLECV